VLIRLSLVRLRRTHRVHQASHLFICSQLPRFCRQKGLLDAAHEAARGNYYQTDQNYHYDRCIR
jgi:hypothetical protein